MTRIDFIVVENGRAFVRYKSGRTMVCDRGTSKGILNTVQAFCAKSLERGKMEIESNNRARFNS